MTRALKKVQLCTEFKELRVICLWLHLLVVACCGK